MTMDLMTTLADDLSMAGPKDPQLSTLARIGLVGIVLFAAGLRLVGIDFGRPYVYHPDEGFIVQPALNIVRTGDLDPHAYTYPSGLMYAEAALVAVLRPVTGLPIDTTRVQPIGQMSDRGPSDLRPEQFTYDLAGRILVALMGALSVLFAGLAGTRIAGPVAGLAAAAFLAIMPLGVVNAHYLTTDVPTSFAVAACLWLTAEGTRRGPRWFIAAGVVAGIAASTKYNGAFVLGVPLLTYLLSIGHVAGLRRRATVATLLTITCAGVIGFVALTPSVVFRASAVLEALLWQAGQYGGHAGAEGSDNWRSYLQFLFGEQRLIMTLTAAGLVLAVVRRRPVEVAIAVMTVVYFVIVSVPITRFERNLVPILPAFAVLAGLPIDAAVTGVRRWGSTNMYRAASMLLAAIVVMASFQPARLSVERDPVIPASGHAHDCLGMDPVEPGARLDDRPRGVHASGVGTRIPIFMGVRATWASACRLPRARRGVPHRE